MDVVDCLEKIFGLHCVLSATVDLHMHEPWSFHAESSFQSPGAEGSPRLHAMQCAGEI